MANQVVKAYLTSGPSAGAITWELSDSTGIQSFGAIPRSLNPLTMNVTYGLPQDHNYTLRFKDANGNVVSGAKLNYAEGGIIIIENVDITGGNPRYVKETAQLSQSKRK